MPTLPQLNLVRKAYFIGTYPGYNYKPDIGQRRIQAGSLKQGHVYQQKGVGTGHIKTFGCIKMHGDK